MSNWFTDTQQFRNAIGSLRISGGGDEPETPIDGLEMARRLRFRGSASKFVILITDATFKVNNQYGITSMTQMAGMLYNDEIITSVICPVGYQSLYSTLYQITGGVVGDIRGNFSNTLLQLASMIGEVTNDGYWLMLDDFQIIKLDGHPSEGYDTDGDTILDRDELIAPIQIDMTRHIANLIDSHGLAHLGYATDIPLSRAHVEAWSYRSNPFLPDTDGDGLPDNRDPIPKNPYDRRFEFVNSMAHRPTLRHVDFDMQVSNATHGALPPERGDFVYRRYLENVQDRAFLTAMGGATIAMPNACAFLLHFLMNHGEPKVFDAKRLMATDGGTIEFNRNMDAFLTAAEGMVMDGETIVIATRDQGFPGEFPNLRPNWLWASDGGTWNSWRAVDRDWKFAVNYTTANMVATVSRDGVNYTIELNYFVDDAYNWEHNFHPIEAFGGLVVDGEMALLHSAGYAREYRIDGSVRGIIINHRYGQRFTGTNNNPSLILP